MKSSVLLAKTLRIVGESRRQKHIIGEKNGYVGGNGSGRILHVLMTEDKISQRELAARLDIRPQSLTTALLKMEEEGLILRERNECDKREQTLRITDEGVKVGESLHTQFCEVSDILFSCLTEDEKETLSDLLEKVTRSFVSKEEE